MIIDIHTHIFPRHIAEKTLEKLGTAAHIRPHTDGTLYGLLVSMRHHGITYSVTQPAVTNPGSVEHLNSTVIEKLLPLQNQGILPFGGMHPDYPHVRRELLRLKNAGVRGIKLHPAYQKADRNSSLNNVTLPRASLCTTKFVVSPAVLVIVHIEQSITPLRYPAHLFKKRK